MSDRIGIVCADWSEWALLALPGNRTDACASCGSPVVISTEGRSFRRQHPDAELRCVSCAIRDHPDVVPEHVPGALERALRSGFPLSAAGRLARTRRPLRDYGADNVS